METNTDTKEPKLPNTTEERALFTIITYSDAIHNALHRSFNLSAWFKAYTQSEDFANLAKEYKAEAFDTYENLKYLLGSVEQDMDELVKNYPH